SIHKNICNLCSRTTKGFPLLLCYINSLTLALSYSIPFLLCHPREDLQDKVGYEGSHTVFILRGIKKGHVQNNYVSLKFLSNGIPLLHDFFFIPTKTIKRMDI